MPVFANINKKVIAFWLVAVGAGMLCLWLHPLEPRFQGRRLSEWAEAMTGEFYDEEDAHPAEVSRAEAIHAIQQIGARALPYALGWCRARDSWFGRILPSDRREGGVHGFEFFSADEAHCMSRETFEALGAGGAPAIPDLIKLLGNRDRGVAWTASVDLACIGEEAIPALLEALTNQTIQVRGCAVSALGVIGERFRTVTQFKDPQGGVKMVLGKVEGRYKPQMQLIQAGLLSALQDNNPEVRSFAGMAITRCDIDAEAAVPALLAALKREMAFASRDVSRPGIFIALGHFKTNSAAAVPLLLELVRSNSMPATFYPPLRALYQIDPEAARPFIQKWRTNFPNEPATNSPRLRLERVGRSSRMTNAP